MTNKEIARRHIVEQARAYVLDEIPSFLGNFYKRLVEEGFNDIQAMHLVTVYMKSLIIESKKEEEESS